MLEVGGSGALLATPNFIMAKLAPFVGWFPYDGLELTFFQEIFCATDDMDTLHVSTLGVIEISGHLRLTDRWLAFFGVGPGLLWDGEDFGFALKSRLGTDILVGRSGIFRPNVFLMWSSSEVLDLVGTPSQDAFGYGLELAYAAMF